MKENISKIFRFLREQIIGLAVALQFLSVLPPAIQRPFTPREMGVAVSYYPLVGIIFGIILTGLHWALVKIFPPFIAAVLLIGAWEALSGALHMDGFLDCCDGLFGWHSTEDRLRIMRDHNVGAFAVTGGIILLLVKYAALTGSVKPTIALILAPLLGRWAITVAIVAFPYARPQGLGRTMKDNAGFRQLSVSTVITVLAVLLVGGWMGLIGLIISAITLLAVSRFVLSRLPGMTGDTYGATCQAVETAIVLMYSSVIL